MADTYTPEEINEIFGAYNRAIKDGTPITADLTRQMKDAATGVKNYTANLNNSLKGLGNTALKLVENLKDGAQGASVFNDGLSAGADAIDAFASRFGIVGKIIGGLVTAGARYAAEANKQSDALYKSYQDLTRFGQGTARGMDDVFSTMQKFSYGIGELDQMTALLRENSKNLALFGGTVAQGTEAMSNVADQFKNSDLQAYFLKMGISVDNQNRGIAGYIKQLTMLGQTQGKNQAELTQGAAAYLKEMEGLTRLTGQGREEMEQQRNAAMAVDQFAVTVGELGKSGDEMQKVFNILHSINPALATGFAEGASGFLTGSKEQNQLFQLSGGRLMGLMDQLKQGAINAAQFIDAMAPKGAQLEILKGMARVPGQLRDFAGGYSDIIKLNSKNWTESAKTAEGQIEVTGEVTDAAVSLRQSQMRARDALQSMINDGVLPATQAMSKLAGITDSAAEGSKGFWDKVKDWFSGEKAGGTDARSQVEQYLGQKFNDRDYSDLLKATHAEAAAGKQGNQQEQAMIMASILNRARTNPGGIHGALYAEGQFQSVTGTAANSYQPSQAFLTGPQGERLKSIEGAAAMLAGISKEQKNFTAANAAAYGPGTNIGYRNKMLAAGGTVIGGTVFQTGSTGPISSPATTTTGSPIIPAADVAAMDRARASQQTLSGYQPNTNSYTDGLKNTSENQQNPAGATTKSQKNTPVNQTAQNSNSEKMMMIQIEKLDRLIQVMQNQVNISTKILQASR